MDNIGNRYVVDQTLKKMTNGLLARGIDTTLSRHVLLYILEQTDESEHQEAWRWMRKASQMSDERFMPILDSGSEGRTLFAALQAEKGKPLTDRLNELEVTGRQALAYVQELSKGIRETRRKGLPDCSVDADNLWMEDNGRMRIMNYWSEGNNGRRGVPGLALLLYQLGAKTDIPTSSMSAYSFEMNRLFADLPEAARERAAALACKAYEGTCTLADFQRELDVLLSTEGEVLEAPLKPVHVRKPVKAEPRNHTSSDRTASKRSGQLRESFRRYRWHLFAAAGFSLLVVVLSLSLHSNEDQATGSLPQPMPQADSRAEPATRTEPAKPTESAPAKPAQVTAPPPANTKDSEAKPVNNGTVQVKAGVVPNLVALTKEEAEKMAMASGLRYQFFLESSAAVQGVVFKQDLTPGSAVQDGDRITFWVSKGK